MKRMDCLTVNHLQIKAINEDKVQKLNESLDDMQDDVRKKPVIQEIRMNELKRTDFTNDAVDVDEAADILGKL